MISMLKAKEAHKESSDLKWATLFFFEGNESCNIADEIRTPWAGIQREMA